MLVLYRKEGQWTEIIHKSGDVIRFKIGEPSENDRNGRRRVIFDDQERNFDVARPERVKGKPE
jgi:hypothetical protein